MASTIQIRVEDELKIKSDILFKALGTDTTSAIRMFLAKAVAVDGFPFDIKREIAEYNPYAPMTEEELLIQLETSRKHAEQGKYRSADDVVSDLRAKYAL